MSKERNTLCLSCGHENSMILDVNVPDGETINGVCPSCGNNHCIFILPPHKQPNTYEITGKFTGPFTGGIMDLAALLGIEEELKESTVASEMLHEFMGELMAKTSIPAVMTAYFLELGIILNWAEEQHGKAGVRAVIDSIADVLNSAGYPTVISNEKEDKR